MSVTLFPTPPDAGDTLQSEGDLINSAISKATPVDADQIGLMDSAAGNILKKLSWANLKATLKTYFDTLYATIAGLALKSDIASPTFTGTVTTPAIIISGETASRVAYLDGSKNIKSVDTATYPTLTEFSYVKGVTSAIQTQMDLKAPLASPTLTGTPAAPTAAAGTNTTQIATTAFARTHVASTSGVASSPTASSTETITHGLGRVPQTIRIFGIGAFVNNAAATPTPFSMGAYTTSGNTCVYMTSAGTSAQAPQTSTVFSVFLATSSGNTISGVIQNLTSTGFDIVWTETGTSAAQKYLWEAQ